MVFAQLTYRESLRAIEVCLSTQAAKLYHMGFREPVRRSIFFKWIKQHLRIKRFYGTSENVVKTQIWIAVSVYVLAAIVRKRRKLEVSLYTFMQVFSVSVFEKMPIQSAFLPAGDRYDTVIENNQLDLFDSCLSG